MSVTSRSSPLQWRLLTAIGSGTLLNPLNSSMIAVALIDIRHTFGISFATSSWLIASYYLTSAVGQPLLGRVGDIVGRRRVFLAGLVVVAVASSLAPFTRTFGTLLAARVVQALGTSALFPSGIGMVRATHREGQARALGVLSVFASVSAGIGPTVGGYLVAWAGWPGIFTVNLPIVVLSAALAARALPPDPARPPARLTVRRLDLPGVALFAVTGVAGLWWLMSLGRQIQWPGLVVAVAAAAGLVHVERRVGRSSPPQPSTPQVPVRPFLDLHALVAGRRLLAVYVAYAAVNIVFYAIFFGIPSYLQAVEAHSASTAGLIMLPLAALGIVATPVAARLVDRYGAGPVLAVGVLILTVGCAGLVAVQPAWPTAGLAVLLGLLGLANGATNLALQVAMYDAAPAQEVGAASGLFQTSRYVGTILASTLLSLVFGRGLDAARLHILGIVLTAVAASLLAALLVRRLSSRPA